MRGFRWNTWYTFAFIVLLTLSAVWIDIPGDRIDPFGWKQHVFVHQGLDLQGGLQVVLQAKPAPANPSVAAPCRVRSRRLSAV